MSSEGSAPCWYVRTLSTLQFYPANPAFIAGFVPLYVPVLLTMPRLSPNQHFRGPLNSPESFCIHPTKVVVVLHAICADAVELVFVSFSTILNLVRAT
ncbi:hypothetical protein BJ508DRAFT_31238 [Ascobolus immersus RN42]|uniref:Uncharacterized protein n=1 Tax=Ascobolus immersus RN42 TaxID=1160509 RepID=A0A3N4ISD6_ASCIM|nr:hypothetical protein BJ508DRAFT_31238 [Ascobolus immersus RN42]